LSLFKNSATWNYLKWFILLTKEKFSQAIIYLEKSNKLAQNNPEVLRNLGWAYYMKWDTIKWLWILKRALILAPEDVLIQEDLAMALIWTWEVSEWNKILTKIWKK
jgi:Flp pilus assembly protein TadD